MQDNNNISELKNGGELLTVINGKMVSDRSSLLIEQMKEKLERCERKAVQRINELDLVLSQEGLEDRTQSEIRLWQEKYKLKQDMKENSFKNKVIDKLIKWSI